MVVLLHAPILLALIALQFHGSGLDKPSPFWQALTRALTFLAIPGALIALWAGGVVGYRVAIAAAIIAAVGTSRYRNLESVTRWYRWLELASWCLCVLAVCGAISMVLVFRQFNVK
jgi:hypothetical protein